MRYVWPEDKRCKGPHCRPQPPPWRACAQRGSQGQAHLVSGDLWLTREAPEMPTPAFLRGAAAAPGCQLPPAGGVAAPGRSWHERSQGTSRSWADAGVVSWADAGAWERQAPESRVPGRSRPPKRDPSLGWKRSPEERRRAWDEALEKRLVSKTATVPMADRASEKPAGGGFCEARVRPTLGNTAAEAARCQRPADAGPVLVQREDAPHRSQGCRGELRFGLVLGLLSSPCCCHWS